MPRSLQYVFCSALLTLIIMPAQALERFSAGTYSELNKTLFVAELWLPEGSDAESLLNAQAPFDVRLTILANSIGSRQFRRIWLEGAAINNSAEVLQPLEQPLTQFTKALKGRLQYGDSFQVRYTHRGTTVISLNDVTLMSTNNNAFAAILMSSWLGSVPLSADFKRQLLDGNDELPVLNLKTRISYSEQRQKEIRRWIEPARIVTVRKAPKVVAAVATNHLKPVPNEHLKPSWENLTPAQLAHLPPAHSGTNP